MKVLTLWLMIACLLVSMSLAGGCSIDEMITVDVPSQTRQHFREHLETSVPPELTLRDARILRAEGDRQIEARIKAQLADHAASNAALDAELADGRFIESLIAATANTGIDLALPGLAAVPGGAILTTLLAGFGMWLIPRPGDAKRQADQFKQAEDKGYDLGRDEALQLFERLKGDILLGTQPNPARPIRQPVDE